MIKPEHIPPDVGDFQFYLDAFNELSTCRPSGFGTGPIPFTAIKEYFTMYEVEDFLDFLEVIRIMDREYLSIQSKKNKPKTEKKETPKQAPPRKRR